MKVIAPFALTLPTIFALLTAFRSTALLDRNMPAMSRLGLLKLIAPASIRPLPVIVMLRVAPPTPFVPNVVAPPLMILPDRVTVSAPVTVTVPGLSTVPALVTF